MGGAQWVAAQARARPGAMSPSTLAMASARSPSAGDTSGVGYAQRAVDAHHAAARVGGEPVTRAARPAGELRAAPPTDLRCAGRAACAWAGFSSACIVAWPPSRVRGVAGALSGEVAMARFFRKDCGGADKIAASPDLPLAARRQARFDADQDRAISPRLPRAGRRAASPCCASPALPWPRALARAAGRG